MQHCFLIQDLLLGLGSLCLLLILALAFGICQPLSPPQCNELQSTKIRDLETHHCHECATPAPEEGPMHRLDVAKYGCVPIFPLHKLRRCIGV